VKRLLTCSAEGFKSLCRRGGGGEQKYDGYSELKQGGMFRKPKAKMKLCSFYGGTNQAQSGQVLFRHEKGGRGCKKSCLKRGAKTQRYNHVRCFNNAQNNFEEKCETTKKSHI
jgi:hypothetical protein